MFQKSRLKRLIATFLLLNMVLYIFQPLVAHASLTAGPTAPEYTSFEPVDTTDMVNLATGDFTYNIPLLEVPGPEGGYPLSLSYHAGIQPNEEASWVGLGWTLNPGAINRTVNGYADDHLEADRVRRDVWSGGERHTLSVGIGYAGASFGLSVSHDSNLGFGYGMNVGFGKGFGEGRTSPSIGIGAGANSYGESFVQPNIGLRVAGVNKGQQDLNVSTNFKSLSASLSSARRVDSDGKVSGGNSLLGISLSSNSLKPTASIAGISASQSNRNSGQVQTQGWGVNLPLELVGLPFNLGYNYMRYFSDEKDNVKVVGPLHFSKGFWNPEVNALDSYALNESLTDEQTDPEREKGGSLPAYDNYYVNAQGLSGSIQPYIFENGSLLRQNIYKQNSSTDRLVTFYQPTRFSKSVKFRFKNDFSAKLNYSDQVGMDLDPAEGNHLNDGAKELFAGTFNMNDNHLAGSKHVEWFTNEEIKNNSAKNHFGFVDYDNQNLAGKALERVNTLSDKLKDQIGGYMVTNESGVTYHYALPTYAFNQYSKSFLSEDPGTFVEYEDFDPYATNWLLTAITGPDFVDRNDDGFADKGDWGYWVTFDYGLWAEDYKWANPINGTHPDLDQKTSFFSRGEKELYYLNSISTRSHIAIFEKEIRADAKGVLGFDLDGVNDNSVGFARNESQAMPQFFSTGHSQASLKLNRIILFDRSKFEGLPVGPTFGPLRRASNDITDPGNTYDHEFTFFNSDGSTFRKRVHWGENVIDKRDIAIQDPTLIDALRVIEFDHDYSLMDGNGDVGIPNSFDAAGEMYVSQPASSVVDEKLGKLTLKKLYFKGKDPIGVASPASIIPPLDFTYNNTDPNTYAYDFEAVDNWGLYKSDFDNTIVNQNLRTRRSANSANTLDSWSLSTINTSLGATIKVNYESDRYIKPDLYTASSVAIEQFEDLGNGFIRLTPFDDVGDLTSISDAIEVAGFDFLFRKNIVFKNPCICDNKGFLAGSIAGNFYEFKEFDNIQFQQIIVNADYIDVQSNDLSSYLAETSSSNYTETTCVQSNGQEFDPEIDILNPVFVASNLFFDDPNLETLGGGLRVSSIDIQDDVSNTVNSTNYTYANGSTSYEPGFEESGRFNYGNWENNSWTAELDRIAESRKEYHRQINKNLASVLAASRELPAPGVIYGSVTISESIQHNGGPIDQVPGKKVFEFQTFEAGMVSRDLDNATQEDLVENYTVSTLIPPLTIMNDWCPDGIPNPDDLFPAPPEPEWVWDGAVCDYESQAHPTAWIHIDVPSTKAITRLTPIVIKDHSVQVGALKSIKTYGANDLLLMETTNQYLDSRDEPLFNSLVESQGKVSQLFNEERFVEQDDGTTERLKVFTRKDEFPHVQLGTTTVNHKTGVTTIGRNLAFDHLTGEPTKVWSSDGFGNQYITESQPAYQLNEYAGSATSVGMGPKVLYSHNKNMLTQSASVTSYKVQEDENGDYTNIGLVSASTQTWSNQFIPLGETNAQTNVWRKHRAYSWVGEKANNLNEDGLYPLSSFVGNEFDAWVTGQDPGSALWQQDAEITLYNVYSKALEVRDLNNQYVATKLDLNQKQVLATATLARYSEFAYSGAEDGTDLSDFGGDVKRNDGTIRTGTTHTGRNSLELGAGQKGFEFVTTDIREGKYRVSLWTTASNAVDIKYQINGGSINISTLLPIQQSGPWFLLRANIDVPTNTTSFSVFTEATALAVLDDFRFHPLQSAMTSFVYNRWGELSHVLNTNNLYTAYEYDDTGLLKTIYQERIGAGRLKLSDQSLQYQKSTN